MLHCVALRCVKGGESERAAQESVVGGGDGDEDRKRSDGVRGDLGG